MAEYQYQVLEFSESMIGEWESAGHGLEKILNEYGAQGWELKSLTPREADGLLVTFQRQVG